MPEYRVAQQERRWAKDIEDYHPRDNADVVVGILGLGVMGSATADLLATAGYRVSAWTRRKREHQRVRCSPDRRFNHDWRTQRRHGEHGCCCGSMYSGADELQTFASGCDILVCLLPLTADTEGIINADLLSWLPKGASVINGARGGHHVEADVLAALDSGQLSYFVTDVAYPEPLPPDSQLWSHPKVRPAACPIT